MLAVGDMMLEANAESSFALAKPTLQAGDVVFGHLEYPHTTRRDARSSRERDWTIGDPNNLSALVSAGFDVVSLAGNHTHDGGVVGIEDTIAWLRKLGIAFVGAGMNLTEARCPVVLERDGTRFGFLAYNAVGPSEGWATLDEPGVAYLKIITHIEPSSSFLGCYDRPLSLPGGTPRASTAYIYTWAEAETLGAMVDDIRKTRPLCDVLVVSLHKGVVNTPIKLAPYEQQISYAAIDAGADLILAHHAHILKGIELYKGKAIFHGLGNFTGFSGARDKALEIKRQQAREQAFGYKLDPEYPNYTYHPEARNIIIAKCIIKDGRVAQVGYIPCLMTKQSQPEIVKHDERGQQVFNYMDTITRGAGLNARYEWEGDEVVIHTL